MKYLNVGMKFECFNWWLFDRNVRNWCCKPSML